MPLDTGNVETLLEICSKTVANHAAELYDKMTASHDKEDSSVVNPFNEWPLLLLERVIDVLTMNDLLNVRHRDLLMNAQTRKLDFPSFCAGENENMVVPFLQLAVFRCPQLTDLVFGGIRSHCTVADYQKFLPHFKHLQVLNVAHNYESFDDRCLKILGIHCSDLRELDVDGCHVTDVGIEWLCGGPKELIGKNVPMELNGLCKSLEELRITVTKITAYGAAMALQRLPHLRILEYEFMAEAFALMHLDNNHVDLAHPEFALTQLEFWEMPFQTRFLCPALSFCPHLTRLFIHIVEGVTDNDLLGITALERLSVLQIWNTCGDRDSCRITFDGSLAPILKTRGRSLNTLDLVHLSNTFICLATVIGYCPNLECLILVNCKYLPTRRDQDLGISRDSERVQPDFEWKRLKDLVLFSSNRCEITAECFLLILTSSPALQTLTIVNSSTLTDDILERVFQCTSFKNLDLLRLIHCPYVTKRGIDLFRKEENILPIDIVTDTHLD